ncbi:MAG: hypothetical protein QOC63_4827 [Mycobacterium sp.]|jgi:uncharacterized protein YjbI with pentapeptide repeats|nr:hypothetical protein [Mycobacterium sp.]
MTSRRLHPAWGMSRRWFVRTAVVVFILLILAAAVWLVPWLMTLRSGLDVSARFKAMADIRTGVVAALVMLGAGGSLFYTEQTFRMNQSANLTHRFESAAKQIGTNDVTVRIAGIYAMAQLADRWREMRQACIDVLCAYLRTNDDTPQSGRANLAALALIYEHLRPNRKVSWVGCDFDLTGVILNDADFSEVRFVDGRFSFDEARLRGAVKFDNARFAADTVSFRNAVFERDCDVTFDDAHFVSGSVNFDEVRLAGGRLSFDRATFDACRVSFSLARLGEHGSLSIEHATVAGQGLGFAKTIFRGEGSVSFADTTFTKPVSFDDAVFDRDVSFKETTLTRTTLSFRQSQFISGTLSFAAARNEGSILVFDAGTKSAGGKIDVNGVHDGPLLLSGPEPPGLILGSVSRV